MNEATRSHSSRASLAMLLTFSEPVSDCLQTPGVTGAIS
jgi:hypothetical protein